MAVRNTYTMLLRKPINPTRCKLWQAAFEAVPQGPICWRVRGDEGAQVRCSKCKPSHMHLLFVPSKANRITLLMEKHPLPSLMGARQVEQPPQKARLYFRGAARGHPLPPAPSSSTAIHCEGANPSGTQAVLGHKPGHLAECSVLLPAPLCPAQQNTRSPANCFVKWEIKSCPLSPPCSTYLPPHHRHLPPAWGPLKGSRRPESTHHIKRFCLL